MNDVHKEEFDALDRENHNLEQLKIGQKVWALRHRGLSANKLTSWWIGPFPITKRIGDSSYAVEIKPGHGCGDDPHTLQKLKLHHFQPTIEEIDAGIDEWEVEKIFAHRKDEFGRLEFLVMWKGFEDKTWEPLMNFIHRYSLDWKNYVAAHHLKFDLVDYMSEKGYSRYPPTDRHLLAGLQMRKKSAPPQ